MPPFCGKDLLAVLHHLLYADITKIHKIIFLFGSYVVFMSLDDLLSISFLSVDAALSRY